MTTSYTEHLRLNLPDFNNSPWHELLNDNFGKLDSVVFRALATQGIIVWDHNTAYTIGTIAFDEDQSSFWFCTTDHTSPATGTFLDYRNAHPGVWTPIALGLAPRGEWTNNTSYQYYDLVYDTSEGVTALCTTPHISSAFPATIRDDAANWAFIVDIQSVLNASTLAFTPTGDISSTNVQGAIEELDADMNVITGDIVDLEAAVNNVVWAMIAASVKASVAEFLTNTANKLLPVQTVWDAAAPFDLGNITGVVTLDCATHLNFIGTLTGNITLANPSNLKPGQTVSVLLTQDGTGGRTISFGNQWFPVGSAALVFNTGAGKRNFVSAQRMTSAVIPYSGGKLE